MAFQHKENRGSLWKNDFHEPDDNQPVYKGDANIGGETFEMAAWVNTTDKGQKYLSLTFQVPRDKREDTPAEPEDEAVDDDLPF